MQKTWAHALSLPLPFNWKLPFPFPINFTLCLHPKLYLITGYWNRTTSCHRLKSVCVWGIMQLAKNRSKSFQSPTLLSQPYQKRREVQEADKPEACSLLNHSEPSKFSRYLPISSASKNRMAILLERWLLYSVESRSLDHGWTISKPCTDKQVPNQ